MMKIRNNISALLLSAAFLALGSCTEEVQAPVQTPAVNSETISPATDESGTVIACIGTQVTLGGFNLDKVGAVTIEDIEATIVEQSISSIIFEIPALPEAEYPQRDNPYQVTLRVYDSDRETVVFTWPYYVTIPVTDAIVESFSPETGTVGDVITISGRNLDQVTAVTFNGIEVGNAYFSEGSSADAVLVPVPAGIESAGASTPVTITAVWGGGRTIDVTSEEKPFTLLVPAFTAFTPEDEYVLGSEIALGGENLDLVSEVRWGEHQLTILEGRTAESITVAIPTNIPQADPVNVTAALTAAYGSPAQTLTIAEEMTVNTTAVGPAEPVYESIESSDGSENIYLRKEVTVRGRNMASVEKFILESQDGDNAEAEVTEKDDYSAKFVIPEEISGTAAKQMTLTAVWNGGNRTEFGEVTIFPFYFQTGLRLGIGSGNNTPESGLSNSFLMLDDLTTISTAEYVEDNVDPYLMSGSNTVTTAQNTVTGSQEEYYGVQPYTFIILSGGKLRMCNPANTANQIRNFVYDDGSGKERLPQTFGTPVLRLEVASDTENPELKAAAANGTLTDIAMFSDRCGSIVVDFAVTEDEKSWTEGSVVIIQYVNYTGASSASFSFDTVYRQGYMVIRDITAGDPVSGSIDTNPDGYVEFDLYWSNVINE